MLLSSLLPLVSAVKVVLLLQPTSWCGTSMSHPADKMTAAYRRIEVIANGLPLWGGVQVAVDTTLVSPLTAAGEPRREGMHTAGAALRHARRAKARTYPELCNSGRCRLVVLGIETGGRWCPEDATFLRLPTRCRARSATPTTTECMHLCLRASVLLAFAAARAFATSLLSLPLSGAANVDGDPPLLSDLLAEASAPLLLLAACPDMPA
eukprot:s988_g7.t1